MACWRICGKPMVILADAGAVGPARCHCEQARFTNVSDYRNSVGLHKCSFTYFRRSKAVADGAIGFFCDHHVSARMSRYMYGVEYLREINNDDEEHRARQGRLLQLPSGPRFLPDAFDCILAKVRDTDTYPMSSFIHF